MRHNLCKRSIPFTLELLEGCIRVVLEVVVGEGGGSRNSSKDTKFKKKTPFERGNCKGDPKKNECPQIKNIKNLNLESLFTYHIHI